MVYWILHNFHGSRSIHVLRIDVFSTNIYIKSEKYYPNRPCDTEEELAKSQNKTGTNLAYTP